MEKVICEGEMNKKLKNIYDLIIAAVQNEKRCDKLLLIFDIDLFIDFRDYCDNYGIQNGHEIALTGMYCLVITPEKRITLHYVISEDKNVYYPDDFYITKIKEKAIYIE
ncbi:hypothetical protein J6S88_03380 [bacterium]|nr:hypothetical protein [bacterium]